MYPSFSVSSWYEDASTTCPEPVFVLTNNTSLHGHPRCSIDFSQKQSLTVYNPYPFVHIVFTQYINKVLNFVDHNVPENIFSYNNIPRI
jgi:hypothetical protein